MTVVAIEFVDHGVQGEYGFFGKVVARTIVRGMTAAEIAAEIAEMHEIVGHHVVAVAIEEIGAAA